MECKLYLLFSRNRLLISPSPIKIYTGVKDQAFEKAFYEQQLVTWAWSAGGFYWSYKLQTSQQDLARGIDYSQVRSALLLTPSDLLLTPITPLVLLVDSPCKLLLNPP